MDNISAIVDALIEYKARGGIVDYSITIKIKLLQLDSSRKLYLLRYNNSKKYLYFIIILIFNPIIEWFRTTITNIIKGFIEYKTIYKAQVKCVINKGYTLNRTFNYFNNAILDSLLINIDNLVTLYFT